MSQLVAAHGGTLIDLVLADAARVEAVARARTLPSLDLTRSGRLEFHPPDIARFPCLALAYRALREGGTLPVVLNALHVTAWCVGERSCEDLGAIAP